MITFDQYMACIDALRAKNLLDEAAAKELYAITFKKTAIRLPGSGRPTLYTHEYVSSWDWSKPDLDISREHNLTISRVRVIRRREGYPAVAAPHNISKLLEERKQWDWSKNDTDLAIEHGMVRERVRQIRAELGMPPISKVKKDIASASEVVFLEWLNGRKIVNFLEAVRETKLNPNTVKKLCAKHGVFRKRKIFAGKWPWELMNWDLPNGRIERAWGMSTNMAASYRSKNGIKKGLAHCRDNAEKIESLFKAEQEKAEKYRAEQQTKNQTVK